MATLTRQLSEFNGVQLTFNSAGGSGDVVDNSDGKTFIIVKNDSGGSINVTITAQDTTANNVGGFGDITVSDSVIAVAASAQKIIGPFPKQRFNNSSKQIAVSYSSTTSITVAACYLKNSL